MQLTPSRWSFQSYLESGLLKGYFQNAFETNFIPDHSGLGLTTTATGAISKKGVQEE